MAIVREDAAILDRGRGDSHGDPLLRAMAAAFDRLHGASVRVRRGLDNFPEIDCLRHRLPPGVIAAAERRAGELGVGADEVLVASGLISEDGYCRALAAHLGLRFVNLDGMPRAACPLSSGLLMQAPSGGLLPLVHHGEIVWALAPRGLTARRLVAQVRTHGALRQCLVITAPEHIRRFVHRREVRTIAWLAAEMLRAVAPRLSAGTRGWRARTRALGTLACFCAALAFAPGATLLASQLVISLVFVAWSALRLVALASSVRKPKAAEAHEPIADRDLPHYTVIVALYREAATLPELVEALRALDYPAEKLDVLLVLEADDPPTRAAAAALKLAAPFAVVIAPVVAPRTKPKALNAALPFARGEFTVVFDAEDKPEPDQLRRAVAAFAADETGRLVCLQARLTIDNTRDNWLTGLFTAEYAGLFDVMLPGLATRRLPIPLGGSSNHFRTRVLRAVGAWDPHNVTEDADLGTRLARAGYRIGVLDSSTYEEAPSGVRPWLRQRMRWLKGWMQTWGVHMRQPLRLLRELGPAGFTTFQLLFIGTVVAALLQPVAWLLILAAGVAHGLSAPDAATLGSGLSAFNWGALTAGYATSIALGLAGLARRRLWRLVVLMPLMIGHWVLLSVAAWGAVFQLLRDPYRWDKTEHGLGRTTRRARASAVKDSDAGRPPTLRAAA